MSASATPETNGAMRVSLGAYQSGVDAALERARAARIAARIWAGDYTVWKDEPTEITNRLGWLRIADEMLGEVERLEALADSVRADGYTHALLLGMGGSSLAPEVFSKTFGPAAGYLTLAVLDSTDPGAVLAYADRLDPAKTLYIVSSKSGGTVETHSFFKYFYNQTAAALGAEAAGAHFVAITDPGSQLNAMAARYGFRAVFDNNPNIGGRYSALSHFGLVPAALLGVDLRTLLTRAAEAARQGAALAADNAADPAILLGLIMGELAGLGRDKVTFFISPALDGLGDWIEQLIAESTGKEGRGILPVVGEPLAAPAVYGADRLFVRISLVGEDADEAALAALEAAGHPVVHLSVAEPIDLGAHFFLWEMATAVAGYCLRINPFDQPNVEAAKKLARQMVQAYHEQGALPPVETAPSSAAALEAFMAQARPGDYVSLQAYVPANPATEAALQTLRLALRDHYHLATTVGYGPRFLHSTGQLHKGDAGHGLFIQFLADDRRDAGIPDEAGAPEAALTFGVLRTAQALGDGRALHEAGRRMIRFDLDGDLVAALARLAAAL